MARARHRHRRPRSRIALSFPCPIRIMSFLLFSVQPSDLQNFAKEGRIMIENVDITNFDKVLVSVFEARLFIL